MASVLFPVSDVAGNKGEFCAVSSPLRWEYLMHSWMAVSALLTQMQTNRQNMACWDQISSQFK